VLYLWGHLTAIHDAMLPLLGLRERLHPEFDVAFVSNPDRSRPTFLRTNRFAGMERRQCRIVEGFENMSWPDWVQRHSAYRKKISRRMLRESLRGPAEPHEHLSYHLGQAVLALKSDRA